MPFMQGAEHFVTGIGLIDAEQENHSDLFFLVPVAVRAFFQVET